MNILIGEATYKQDEKFVAMITWKNITMNTLSRTQKAVTQQ